MAVSWNIQRAATLGGTLAYFALRFMAHGLEPVWMTMAGRVA